MVWPLSKGNQHAVMSLFPRNIYSSKFFCCLLLGAAKCLHFMGRWNRESYVYIPKDCEPFESKVFSCSLRREGQCAAYINYQHDFRVPLLWCKTKQKTKNSFCTGRVQLALLPMPSRGKKGARGTDVVIALSNNILLLIQKPHFCFQNNTHILKTYHRKPQRVTQYILN